MRVRSQQAFEMSADTRRKLRDGEIGAEYL